MQTIKIERITETLEMAETFPLRKSSSFERCLLLARGKCHSPKASLLPCNSCKAAREDHIRIVTRLREGIGNADTSTVKPERCRWTRANGKKGRVIVRNFKGETEVFYQPYKRTL